MEDYRDEGYLPEAMRDYLALLGWSPGGDREVLSLDELIEEFRLEDVKSSPAFFDEKKLQATNAAYIRALSTDDFIERSQDWLRERWAPIAPLVQERARVLGDVPNLVDFLLVTDVVIDDRDWQKGRPPAAGLRGPAGGCHLQHSRPAPGTPRPSKPWWSRWGPAPASRSSARPKPRSVSARPAVSSVLRCSSRWRLLGRDRTLRRLRVAQARLARAVERRHRCDAAAGWSECSSAPLALVVLYLGFTFVEVWLASRRDQARPVQAIVVLGAAQYNGRPSPVLRARLDHAYDLWREKLAPTVVVTGGRSPAIASPRPPPRPTTSRARECPTPTCSARRAGATPGNPWPRRPPS